MELTGGGLLAKRQLTDEESELKRGLLEAGNAAFDNDDFQLALNNYHKASLVDGADAGVWCSLGLAYANLGFNREAWRSYKLALQVDPEHIDTLWYAGEFLCNLEDFELALPLLQQYLTLEKDEGRLSEARELLEEVRNAVGDRGLTDDDPRVLSGVDAEGNERETEENELEGFEYEGELPGFDEDEESEEFDDEDYEELPADTFQASLHLVLSGMQAKCANCHTSIPEDAPYCYSCKAPHFYN